VRPSAMRSHAGQKKRVLAVDPTSRGFGFAVLEGPGRLLDWGLVHTRTDKRARTIEGVADLLDRYRPEVLVLEEAAGSRRAARIRALLRSVAELARRRKVRA